MKKILIIEDEKDARTYLDTLFKDNGYETLLADGGQEGIDMAKKDKPDLVTLDINMPEKTGVKVYKEFREDAALKGIPIVVVTAVTGYRNEPDSFHQFLASRKHLAPPDGFMSKPIDREKLVKTIKDLIG